LRLPGGPAGSPEMFIGTGTSQTQRIKGPDPSSDQVCSASQERKP
jgi:hypothetical protein